MSDYTVALGRHLRDVRVSVEISQETAAAAIAVSQATYSRIEAGERALKGAELVLLADAFGVRAAAITGALEVQENARFAARTDGSPASMDAMREKLYSYLELDTYLTGQGITEP